MSCKTLASASFSFLFPAKASTIIKIVLFSSSGRDSMILTFSMIEQTEELISSNLVSELKSSEILTPISLAILSGVDREGSFTPSRRLSLRCPW